MIVKELIKKLKKMPQDLEVQIANHDNSECESSGIVYSVVYFQKKNYNSNEVGDEGDKQRFNDMPNECIIIRG